MLRGMKADLRAPRDLGCEVLGGGEMLEGEAEAEARDGVGLERRRVRKSELFIAGPGR